MKISIIAAVGKNNEIGKDGGLIWHFRADMRFFKETTMGASVIMGRKTFQSLPKALEGRQNIVLTNSKSFMAQGAQIAHSEEEALAICSEEEVFIIGGERVYQAFLPRAKKIYLTEIDASCEGADAFFPQFDKTLYEKSVIASYTENDIGFKHVLYEKL